MSAFARRALIGSLPRTPVTGDALLFSWALSSGGQNQVGLSFLPRGHRPLLVGNLKCLRGTGTAYLGKARAAGQLPRPLPDHYRTKQVGMQEAVYVRGEIF